MTKLALLLAALPLAACVSSSDTATLPSAQEAFWDALQSHCGKAYAGKLASTDERDKDWQGRKMVAHWAECDERRIAIAFHVEAADKSTWDRSRTWIVTREQIENAARSFSVALALKHDHRHEDGTADAVTFYGGVTVGQGTARAQDFPVDAYSIALFQQQGLAASLTNVWRIEVDPAGEGGAQFAYQLNRRNDPTRRFRVEFDASNPVAAPPPAWGW